MVSHSRIAFGMATDHVLLCICIPATSSSPVMSLNAFWTFDGVFLSTSLSVRIVLQICPMLNIFDEFVCPNLKCFVWFMILGHQLWLANIETTYSVSKQSQQGVCIFGDLVVIPQNNIIIVKFPDTSRREIFVYEIGAVGSGRVF